MYHVHLTMCTRVHYTQATQYADWSSQQPVAVCKGPPPAKPPPTKAPSTAFPVQRRLSCAWHAGKVSTSKDAAALISAGRLIRLWPCRLSVWHYSPKVGLMCSFKAWELEDRSKILIKMQKFEWICAPVSCIHTWFSVHGKGACIGMKYVTQSLLGDILDGNWTPTNFSDKVTNALWILQL